MVVIKTDPAQTKQVVALLGVLVVIGGVTIVRLKPESAAPAVASAQAAPSETRAASARGDVVFDRTRNPFQRPADLDAMLSASHIEEHGAGPGWPGGRASVTEDSTGDSSHVDPLTVAPMPGYNTPGKDGGQPGGASPDKQAESDKPKPAFALLTTVKGERGYSAVIRCGDSDVRVVEAGDMLEGGFTVKKIEPTWAVLTNGRDTIVAKRPQY